MTLLQQEGWTRWPTEVPSNPYHSVILWTGKYWHPCKHTSCPLKQKQQTFKRSTGWKQLFWVWLGTYHLSCVTQNGIGICGWEEALAEDKDAPEFPNGKGMIGNFRALGHWGWEWRGLKCAVEPASHWVHGVFYLVRLWTFIFQAHLLLKVSLEDQGYDIRDGMKIFGEIPSHLPLSFPVRHPSSVRFLPSWYGLHIVCLTGVRDGLRKKQQMWPKRSDEWLAVRAVVMQQSECRGSLWGRSTTTSQPTAGLPVFAR